MKQNTLLDLQKKFTHHEKRLSLISKSPIKDLNQLGDAKDALFSIVNDISQSKTPKLKDFLALVAYYATYSFT